MMGELSAVINAILWALTGVVTKGVTKNVRPHHIVTAQVWFGVVFLIAVLLVIGQINTLLTVDHRSAIYLGGGALANTVGSLIFWLAISRGTVTAVYPTTQSIFIMVSVFAGWIFLGDEPQLSVIGGASLIIVGVILLNLKPEIDTSATNKPSERQAKSLENRYWHIVKGDYIGIALGVTTSLLWAVGFLSTVIGLEGTSPVIAATIRSLVPAVIFAVIAISFPAIRVTRVINGNGLRLLGSAILFGLSALTFVIALDNAPPSIVVVLINTSPMWAVLFAATILREQPTRFTISGAAFCMAGIFVTLSFQ